MVFCFEDKVQNNTISVTVDYIYDTRIKYSDKRKKYTSSKANSQGEVNADQE